jgi:hypothetical protein
MERVKELERFGRKMNPNTVHGETLADIVSALRRDRNALVVLEPGDATRYRLYLTLPTDMQLAEMGWEPGSVMVGRVFGEQVKTVILPASGLWEGDLDPITNQNPWTLTVFTWWFGLLYDALGVG